MDWPYKADTDLNTLTDRERNRIVAGWNSGFERRGIPLSWWHEPNAELDGLTPTGVWRRDPNRVRDVVRGILCKG